MKYLVGYSADKGGAEALQLAGLLARSSGGSLVVVTVLPQGWGPPSLARVDGEYIRFLEQHAQKTLAGAQKIAPDDVPAEFHARHADSTSDGLIAAAEAFGADSIVLGSSRKAPMARFMEGVVATDILRSAAVPVALAPRGYVAPRGRVTRVTCSVSSSGSSRALALKAGEIAAGFGVPLRLATFIVRDQQMYPTGAGYDAENMVSNQFREQAAAAHEQITAAWPGPEKPELVLGDGRKWKSAVASLDWDPAELLVIGSSHLGGFLRVFVGSNSGKILRHAPVPRMIVPRLAE